jgi:hypothetical protein
MSARNLLDTGLTLGAQSVLRVGALVPLGVALAMLGLYSLVRVTRRRRPSPRGA